MQGYPLPANKQVTLSNWLVFPYNRWSFRNIHTLFPTGTLRSRGKVKQLAYSRKQIDVEKLTLVDSNGQNITGKQYLADEYVDGLIVLSKGKVVYEKYLASMQPYETHLWQSMTKGMTGLLAEMLIANGTLDASKTAGDYVADIKDTPWGKATLRSLLDMEVNVNESSTKAADQSSSLWSNLRIMDYFFLNSTVQAGPNGAAWHYSNMAPQAIGLVMTNVTRKSYYQLAQDLIWSKIGAESDANVWLDKDGQAASAGGLSTTLRDAARYAEVLRTGKSGRIRVIPERVLKYLRKNAGNSNITRAGNVLMLQQNPNMSYRSYWYQVNDGTGSLQALGIYGQHMLINPKDQLVIVQLASYTSSGPNPKDWTDLAETVTSAVRMQRLAAAIRKNLMTAA
uniref:Beta-lactamase-related domain-containing protein n=1 Tax=Chlamydomonas chlamydogama TaxID=225041 RepID=A0A7S2QTM3_9CHLO